MAIKSYFFLNLYYTRSVFQTISSFFSNQREKVKGSNIQAKLEESITTKHIVHASLGKTEFFEFSLKNPSNIDQVVFIKSTDTELK